MAAYEVLVELATGCPENMENIARQLFAMHHTLKPELAKEYEVCHLVLKFSVKNWVFELYSKNPRQNAFN